MDFILTKIKDFLYGRDGFRLLVKYVYIGITFSLAWVAHKKIFGMSPSKGIVILLAYWAAR